MSKSNWTAILALLALLASAAETPGQSAPYVGFVYPAGGQQGTTLEVRLGGQRIDGVHDALVSGEGVSATVKHLYRKLSPQEITLLKEQLKQLQRAASRATAAGEEVDESSRQFIERIETRIRHWVNRPASESLSSIAILEVVIAPDAEPGAREIRLISSLGISNPLVFHVGQLREYSRQPMLTSAFQVLGKEELAQRTRPPEQVEARIELPCILNGQIASGERNHYRFTARQGQCIVVSTKARELIPFIADAVPGWFQPVIAIHDAEGNELAFNDDFRFKPDPTLRFDVPSDGEYVLTITDAIYRGREDFVYRITIGEVPLVTSIFPLGGQLTGGQLGMNLDIDLQGWNLGGTRLIPPADKAAAGMHLLAAECDGLRVGTLPFALDTLPECTDVEPNNHRLKPQPVPLPILINGRIDRPDDSDVFEISGRAGDTIVAEVLARRLDSPLDSILQVTNATGQRLAVNDDYLDAAAGLNTHHADSHLTVTLPQDGKCYVHLTDTAREGGQAFAYRLRISPPRPDFALRVVPSSFNVRGRVGASVTVYAIRRDGFDGPIQVQFENLPDGLASAPVIVKAGEASARLTLRVLRRESTGPVELRVVGSAEIEDQLVTRAAEPAEDRMQAFLWRHLVPTQNLLALIVDPDFEPASKRARPPRPQPGDMPSEPAAFTKEQVAGRLRQLGLLFDEWLLTDEFYNLMVAQCDVADGSAAVVVKKNRPKK
jgi:hypothetical protein